ncbi:cupredoxin family protein [Acidovorax lacteus]|uniref:cupredoxin domain-containing protein n=1 Tax=Acidovorax lacteus TaxID=1924988 RepID=UPI0031ED49AD
MRITTFLIAISSALTSTSTAFAHGPQGHGSAAGSAHHASAVREQKDWGIAGEASAVRRTITVRMTDDMKFAPATITVTEGETLRIRAVNAGQVLHEIVLGTQAELDAHAELMRKHPNMEHDEPYMAHVEAGQRGDIVWQFNRPGTFAFACLIPGHYEAGMRGTITVRPR